MALNDAILAKEIDTQLESLGFKTNDHSHHHYYNQAVARAVIKHLREFAEVVVTSGPSAGTYKVK